ncbi:MAG: linear amide C-N hydrolase [Pirellulales bacterium]
MFARHLALCATICGLGAFAAAPPARACTGITLRPRDGSIVYARTLEFALDTKSNLIVIPRGKEFVGSTPTEAPGLRWTSKFAVAGMNAFDQPLFLDGLNERGLSVGLFYFPGYAGYQVAGAADIDRTLAPQELGVYLLGTCADVAEAAAATRAVVVAATMFKPMGEVPPCHYIVTDAGGNSLVIEYVAGQLRLHDNRIGVITNSPTFDWHLTNLSNYINLSPTNVPPLDLAGLRIHGFGQGTGMLGLPGDFTPPSRFVRAAAFVNSALPVDTAGEGVLQAFHILNQFDIPKGAARGVEHGSPVADFTQWTSAADLTNGRYYVRTFANSRIRQLDLKSVAPQLDDMATIRLSEAEDIEDVTPAAR